MLGDIQILPRRERGAAATEEVLRVDRPVAARQGVGHQLPSRPGRDSGIAGLVGAGRTEVLRAVAGLEATAEGRMMIDGADCPWPQAVRDAIRRGIVLAPEDRKRQGLVLSRSALSNLMLADIGGPRHRTGDRAGRAAGEGDGAWPGSSASILPGSIPMPSIFRAAISRSSCSASGCNREPRVLLLDEPTRGIDLGAKQEIFQTIRDLSDKGMAVILVSSDFEEVIEYSDRVLVMARGKQIALLDGHEATVERILNLIFAVEDRPAAAGAKQMNEANTMTVRTVSRRRPGRNACPG